MPELSRRTLLIGATTLVTIPAGRASAESTRTLPAVAVVSARTPRDAAGFLDAVAGQIGAVRVSVRLGASLDAVGLRMLLQNTGSADETVSALFTDLQTGRTRQRTLKLPAGRIRSRIVYGHLNHQFTIQFCLADGTTCTTLGPVGPQAWSATLARQPRGLSVPPQTSVSD